MWHPDPTIARRRIPGQGKYVGLTRMPARDFHQAPVALSRYVEIAYDDAQVKGKQVIDGRGHSGLDADAIIDRLVKGRVRRRKTPAHHPFVSPPNLLHRVGARL